MARKRLEVGAGEHRQVLARLQDSLARSDRAVARSATLVAESRRVLSVGVDQPPPDVRAEALAAIAYHERAISQLLRRIDELDGAAAQENTSRP